MNDLYYTAAELSATAADLAASIAEGRACPDLLGHARDLLDTLADPAPPPEYVLAFTPPSMCARLRDRLTLPGWWDLLTVADYQAGNLPPDGWTAVTPENTPAADLAAWATRLLGRPVALEADQTSLRADAPFARWRAVPLYWVTGAVRATAPDLPVPYILTPKAIAALAEDTR